jgi:hypothetical protein
MSTGNDYDIDGDNDGEEAGIVMALGEARLGIYHIQRRYLTFIPSPLSSNFIELLIVETQETIHPHDLEKMNFRRQHKMTAIQVRDV